MTHFDVAGETHVGRKRHHNEDNFAILADHGLFIVADGMGGHAGGEVASKMAVDTIGDFFRATAAAKALPYRIDRTKSYAENRLIMSVKLANRRIHQAATRDRRKTGMGTTFAGVYLRGIGAYVVHVGDSRVYQFRHGRLIQLTEDHSLANEYVKKGHLAPEDIETFSGKHIVMRALGAQPTVKVDTLFATTQPGDLLLACSDGLTGPVKDDEIADILRANPDVRTATRKLIERANDNGGPDNVTCVLARFVENT